MGSLNIPYEADTWHCNETLFHVFYAPMTGDELRQFRKSLNLSQASFAKILKVSRVTIARAEKMKTLSRIMSLSLDHALRDGLFRFKAKPK